MKNFYLVHNDEAIAIKSHELNVYPFTAEHASDDTSDRFSEDWHAYDSTGTQWCVAYAENDQDAVALTRASHHGLVARENVWCEIGRVPYEARAK
jgi:hypothetical protein